MNQRRNPTLSADNRFFWSSFHGFSRADDSVAQRLWTDWRSIAIALLDLVPNVGDPGGTTEVVPFPSDLREQIVDRFKTAEAYLP